MKRFAAAMTAGLLLTAGPTGAAAAWRTPPASPASRHAAVVPSGHPAYSDMAALLRENASLGIVGGGSPPKAGEPLTRAEFAVLTARALEKGFAGFSFRGYEQKREVLIPLRRLLNEFEAEIRALGVDVDSVRRSFASLLIPSDFWGYAALERLRKEPVRFRLFYDDERPFAALSRREFAETTLRFLENVAATPPEERIHLYRLFREFEDELRLLGANMETLKATAETYRYGSPFPDVPAGHWAAPAVETIRRAGILTGYPGGRFHAPAK